MIAQLDKLPVTTILVVIVALVGGVIAILHPETLSFAGYAEKLGIAAGGLGVLGIARSDSGKGQ
jgi:hypothetical protein